MANHHHSSPPTLRVCPASGLEALASTGREARLVRVGCSPGSRVTQSVILFEHG